MYNICDYCYIKEEGSQAPSDMDVSDFSNILDWFIMLKVNEIILLGGEPTLYPLFKELLHIIRTSKISTRIFTNGTYKNHIAKLILENEYIKTVFFHYDEKYLRDSNDIKVFLKNIEEASLSNKKIWLRWNIDKPDIDCSRLISLCKKYSASIGYSLSAPTSKANPIPISTANRYADSLIYLVRSASENMIRIEPARATPLCLFDDEQLEFLKNKGNLQGICTAINDLTVNTDLTLQLCSITHTIRTTRVSGLDDLKEKIEFLKKEETELRSRPSIPECEECKLFKNGECQGGCYAYKIYGKTLKVNTTNLTLKNASK